MSLFHPADAFCDEPIQNKEERSSSWFIWVAKWIIRPLAFLIWRIEVRGKENIPAPGEEPVVFVANHVSYIDPVALWVSAPPTIIRFFARSSLWRFKALGHLVSRVGAIPVDPESADTKAIKRAAAALKRGECVGIFAEGTRMRKHDKVYKPHAGFVLVANMGKAKIVPVGITGTDRIKPPDAKLPRIPKIIVTFGEPIDPKDYKSVPKQERTQRIVDDTMTRVFALRDAADTHGPVRPGLPPWGIVPGVDTPEESTADEG